MKIFGLAGWSGSGKTTLIVELIPEITARGVVVSTMKHTHHRFDIDRPGKDSFNHRQAGAQEVMIVSSTRWALMNELRDKPEPSINELLDRMSPVDLVLIEGFKSYPHPKIEVYRPSINKPMLCSEDPSVVAIATDEPLQGVSLPILDLNNATMIVNFILDYVELSEARRGTA